VAGGLVSLAWLYLCWTSRSYADADLLALLLVSIFIAIVSAWLWSHANKPGQQLSLVWIVGFAIAFRIIGFFTYPVLEDDFFRFLWDGYQTASNGSPYGNAPSFFFGAELPEKFDGILDSINYPDVATIYGPTAQWAFYLAHQMAPGEIWPLKLLILAADIAILLLLARTVPNSVLMLYAWSPLIVKEFVISVHPDILGLLFMLLALRAYTLKQDMTLGVMLALSAGVKLFALVILPFLILWRWRAWLGFIATAVVIALPFGLFASWAPEGLAAMSSGWLFNAPLYELLNVFFTLQQAKSILLSCFILVGGAYGLHWAWQAFQARADDPRPIPRGDLLFALMLFCLPAFNPWYAIWLVPFVLYWPRSWVWVGSLSILLSYASGINLSGEFWGQFGIEVQDYQHPRWVLVVEFGLIITAFVISAVASTKTKT